MTSMICSPSLKSMFLSCVRKTCKVDGCELKLNGFPGERVILNIDCIMGSTEAGRRCDYAVVADEQGDTFLLPVEFKSKNLDPAKIKEQLEGGIRFFQEHLPRQFKCYPVLVSKKVTSQVRSRLRKIKIQYCEGRKAAVKYIACNKSLCWGEVKR